MRTLVLIVLMLVSAPVWAQPNRPQTPVGPFTYLVEEVTIPVADPDDPEQSFTLAGTLTIPDPEVFGDGPFVGVVLMSGSGMQDRDSMIFEHRPFMVIADYLTARGIAVLRYDDRVVGASTGSAEGLTTQDLAHDGLAAARFMMTHASVDPQRVGVMGHSEGGMHVPFVACEDEDIAFVISLAGVGVTGAQLLADQTGVMYRAGGKDEAYIEGSQQRRMAIFDAIRDDADDEAILDLIVELNMFEYGVETASDAMRNTSRQMMRQFTNSWTRSFGLFDSRAYWRQIEVPALIMNGSRDTQVDAQINLSAIREALNETNRTGYTIIELADLNHLFQHAKTGLLGEYATIEETFAPEALALIEVWIRSEIVER